MRSTVGPLPAAVYWRRRAVVLGALLLGVIVLFVSCSGGDDKNSDRGTGASSGAPISPSVSATPEDEPSFTDPGPGAGNPSLPDPGDLTASGAGANPSAGTDDGSGDDGDDDAQGGTNDTNVTAPSAGTCTDAEMSVTAVPATTTIRRGASVAVELKIKNISARTCTRDVGADVQELYIEQGAGRVWSSDTCSAAKGSDVYSFPPNGVRAFDVSWNGKQATKCTTGQAAGPAPPVGQYEMRYRLGAKISAPVALTITA